MWTRIGRGPGVLFQGTRLAGAQVAAAPLPWARAYSEEASGPPPPRAGRGSGGSGASKMRAHARPVQGKLFPERQGGRGGRREDRSFPRQAGGRGGGGPGAGGYQRPDGGDRQQQQQWSSGGRGRGQGLPSGRTSHKPRVARPDGAPDPEDLEEGTMRRKNTFKTGRGIGFDQLTDQSQDRRRAPRPTGRKAQRSDGGSDFNRRKRSMQDDVSSNDEEGMGELFSRSSRSTRSADKGGGIFGVAESRRAAAAEEELIQPVQMGTSKMSGRFSRSQLEQIYLRDEADMKERLRKKEEFEQLLHSGAPDEVVGDKRLAMFDEASLQNFQTDITLFMKEVTRNYTDMALAKFYTWHEAIMKDKERRQRRNARFNEQRKKYKAKRKEIRAERRVPKTLRSMQTKGYVTVDSIYEEAKLQVDEERGIKPPAEYEEVLNHYLQGFGRNPTFSPSEKVWFMKKAINFFTDAPPQAKKLVAQVEALRASSLASAEDTGEESTMQQ